MIVNALFGLSFAGIRLAAISSVGSNSNNNNTHHRDAIVIATTSSYNNTSFASSRPLRIVRLRSGLEMPTLGYGTCCRPSAKGEALYESTKFYLKHGGRLIDAAMSYGNHKELGRAVRDANISRHDIWITSKLTPDAVQSYDETVHAVDNILLELGTDYLDLILIHWPSLVNKRLQNYGVV
jgi:Aldo/keto reductase family